jgi:hypothetical protein
MSVRRRIGVIDLIALQVLVAGRQEPVQAIVRQEPVQAIGRQEPVQAIGRQEPVQAIGRLEPAQAIGRRPLSQADPGSPPTSVLLHHQDSAQRPNRASPRISVRHRRQASVRHRRQVNDRHRRQVNVLKTDRIPMPGGGQAIRVPTPVDEPALLEEATTHRLIAPQAIAAGQV